MPAYYKYIKYQNTYYASYKGFVCASATGSCSSELNISMKQNALSQIGWHLLLFCLLFQLKIWDI